MKVAAVVGGVVSGKYAIMNLLHLTIIVGRVGGATSRREAVIVV